MTKTEQIQEPERLTLERCPYCGEKKKLDHAHGYDKTPGDVVYWVYCRMCKASGPVKKFLTDAAKAWNTSILENGSRG